MMVTLRLTFTLFEHFVSFKMRPYMHSLKLINMCYILYTCCFMIWYWNKLDINIEIKFYDMILKWLWYWNKVDFLMYFCCCFMIWYWNKVDITKLLEIFISFNFFCCLLYLFLDNNSAAVSPFDMLYFCIHVLWHHTLYM